jgi:hypothetical protein
MNTTVQQTKHNALHMSRVGLVSSKIVLRGFAALGLAIAIF